MRKLIGIFWGILVGGSVWGHSAPEDPTLKKQKVDSLQRIAKTSTSATEKVNALNQISLLYKDLGKYDKALRFVRKAKGFAQQNGYKKGVSRAHHNLGLIHHNQGKYQQALQYFRQSLLIDNLAGYQIEQAQTLCSIGHVYSSQGKYKRALKKYLKGLEIFKDQGQYKSMASVYNDIGEVYRNKSQYQKAKEYYHKSLNISNRIGPPSHLSFVHNNLGLIYKNQGKFDTARRYYKKALQINKKIGDEEKIAANYGNLGNLEAQEGDYDTATQYLMKCLHSYEKLEDKRSLATTYNNLALIYEDQQKYDEALKYYQKSLSINKTIKYPKGIARSLVNKSIVLERKNKYSKALQSYREALQIAKKLGNKRYEAAIYTNIGDLYTTLFHENRQSTSTQKNLESELQQKSGIRMLDSAQHYLKKGLENQRAIGARQQIPQSLIGLGNVLHQKKRYTGAIRYYRKASSLAAKLGASPLLYKAYKGLSESYQKNGQMEKALLYFKKYEALKDSINNQKTQKKIAQLTSKYKAKKQEKKLTVQEAKLELRQFLLYMAGGGIVIILVLSGLLLNRFRVTQQQKQIIEEQKNIFEQKNQEINSSISYAQRIQSAMLKARIYLDHEFPDKYFILFQPKEAVSGDFYWAFQEGNRFYEGPYEEGDRFFWTVADCTGHGVPGAFMSMIGNMLLNECTVVKKMTEPAEILKELKQVIVDTLKIPGETTQMYDGMDMALCVLNTNTNTLKFAGAKNSLYLVRENPEKVDFNYDRKWEMNGYTLFEFWGVQQPVGFEPHEGDPFRQKKIQLKEGDALYTFSDGLPDQFGGAHGKKFTYKRFKNCLLEIQDYPMPEQKEHLYQTIRDWMAQNNEEQIDDICVMGIRVSELG